MPKDLEYSIALYVLGYRYLSCDLITDNLLVHHEEPYFVPEVKTFHSYDEKSLSSFFPGNVDVVQVKATFLAHIEHDLCELKEYITRRRKEVEERY